MSVLKCSMDCLECTYVPGWVSHKIGYFHVPLITVQSPIRFSLREKQMVLRTSLLVFVGVTRNWCTHRNVMKSSEMKHEITLCHTMETNRNVLFQIHLFGNVHGLLLFRQLCDPVVISETFNLRWHWSIWKPPITTHPTLSSNVEKLKWFIG